MVLVRNSHMPIWINENGVPIKDSKGETLKAKGEDVRISRLQPDVNGHPLEIMKSIPTADPVIGTITRKPMEGAGKATAQIITFLLEKKYFDI